MTQGQTGGPQGVNAPATRQLSEVLQSSLLQTDRDTYVERIQRDRYLGERVLRTTVEARGGSTTLHAEKGTKGEPERGI